ncbi:MAG: hypothetical protein ABI691_17880 [Ginsengibacter sp.]
MCNCGKKRTEYSQQSQRTNVNHSMRMPMQTTSYATFEYTGKTALSVTGKVTGTQYRFNAPGNQQNIDTRDATSLMTVPVLRRLK